MSNFAKRIVLFVLCALSLAVLLFVFELRYIWYLNPSDLWILRGSFAVGALLLIALWIFFPSRLAVAALGLAILTFPTVIPEHRLPISAGFAALVLFCVALLLATNEARRRIGRHVNDQALG